MYHARGEYDRAEPLYRQALSLKEKLVGPLHPDTAMTLNNLAVLLKAQGKMDEAASLYEQALAIFQAVFKPNHPKLLQCRKNYARLPQSFAIPAT